MRLHPDDVSPREFFLAATLQPIISRRREKSRNDSRRRERKKEGRTTGRKRQTPATSGMARRRKEGELSVGPLSPRHLYRLSAPTPSALSFLLRLRGSSERVSTTSERPRLLGPGGSLEKRPASVLAVSSCLLL